MKIMAFTVALAAIPAWADSPPPEKAIPETSYQSAFADYKPFQDEALHDWRQINAEMGRLRGHIGHFETGQGAGRAIHAHEMTIERPLSATGGKP